MSELNRDGLIRKIAGLILLLEHKDAQIAKLKKALDLIAMPKRADGTYNRCREAYEQLAKEALKEFGGRDA